MRLIDADALLEAVIKMTIGQMRVSANYQDIKTLITNAPTVQREGWISVEDEKPEFDKYVTVFNGNVLVAEYTRNEFFKFEDKCVYGVTHWRESTAAPTDKE